MSTIIIPPLPEQEKDFSVSWVKWLRKLVDAVKALALNWTLPVYTMATLPTVQSAGDVAYATDGWNLGEEGYNENGAIVVSNGTSWVTPYHTHYQTCGSSLSPPSMPNNDIWETTITTDSMITPGFGWVSVGNMVSVGAPATIETGFLWNAFVSAEDEITFRLYNRSGGTVAPATATWTFATFPQT